MTNTETTQVPLDRFQKGALTVGGVALGVSLLGAFIGPHEQFFKSYLTAYMLWVGISLGSLAWLMIHYLTLGAWTSIIKRLLEASTRTLPYMAVLFIPIAVGMWMGDLYQWAKPEIVAHDHILQWKQWWITPEKFLLRVVIYFGIWSALMAGLNRLADQFTETSHRKGVRISGIGVLIYALSLTFAVVDWVMTLYPHWASTMHGVFFLVGNGLSTLCFSIIALRLLSDYEPFKSVVAPMHFHDLGKLTFGLTVFWTYVNFGQFLIVYSGNLPEESPFYLARVSPGWEWFTWVLFLFHFAVPFAILLSRNVKRHKRTIAMVATGLFGMRFVDMYWHIHPAFDTTVSLHWLDFAALIGLGGLWLGLWAGQLQKKPLLPPYLPEVHDPHAH